MKIIRTPGAFMAGLVVLAGSVFAGPSIATAAPLTAEAAGPASATVGPQINRWVREERDHFKSRATCEARGAWYVANTPALDHYCYLIPGDAKWSLDLYWPNF
ncbi:hypothetical protein G3H63_03890 [Microbacterium resistens]|uniref:hypothetical protein n=1 Tax=Microbacterium resistens TaxID=156977 RepID=UPI001C56B8FB|nr:hypothetical protein [Microbacterium resistens]MBW1638222.1 hypothetical protein [Microbacterium resistens]